MDNTFKMEKEFTKQDFFNLMDVLHIYAFDANLYLYALEQLENEKYKHIAHRFACCYITMRNALIEALWLNLMRIYDRSTEDGWNIGILLDMAYDMCNAEHKHNGIFKEYKLHINENQEDGTDAFDIKYTYFIHDFDRLPPTLKNEIRNAEKDVEFIRRIFSGDENQFLNKPLEVELTATELINHLSMLVKSQNKKINSLNERRNKLFVHNVQQYLGETERNQFYKKHKLIMKDIKDLATIALRAIICLDNVLNRDEIPENEQTHKAARYSNQDDIVYVLDLLKEASDEEEKND